MRIRRRSPATAAALVSVVVGWTRFHPRAERPKRPLPRPAVTARPAPVALPPTARDVLDGGAPRDLEAAQRTQLRALEPRRLHAEAATEFSRAGRAADSAR